MAEANIPAQRLVTGLDEHPALAGALTAMLLGIHLFEEFAKQHAQKEWSEVHPIVFHYAGTSVLHLKGKRITKMEDFMGGAKEVVVGAVPNTSIQHAATFQIVEPIVQNFGRSFHVGEEPGQAQVVKLANNMLAAAAIFLTAEAMAMGVKAGVDARTMLDIINLSTGRNSASQDKFPKAVLPGTFDFGFATALSYKDVRLCIDEAEAMGVPMVAGAAVRQMLAITNAKYGADSDFTSIAKVVEEWAGIEIRG